MKIIIAFAALIVLLVVGRFIAAILLDIATRGRYIGIVREDTGDYE